MAAKKKQKKIRKSKVQSKGVVHNEETFKVLMKNLRPDIFVLMDLLDSTDLNPYIIFHVIKHLNNIVMGTKYGNVLVSVENGIVTFVRGEEATKLNEQLKKG